MMKLRRLDAHHDRRQQLSKGTEELGPRYLPLMVKMLVSACARRDEVRCLWKEWINWETGVILIPAYMTKTNLEKRINLDSRTLAELKDLVAYTEQTIDSPFIFPGPRGVNPIDIRKAWKPLARRQK